MASGVLGHHGNHVVTLVVTMVMNVDVAPDHVISLHQPMVELHAGERAWRSLTAPVSKLYRRVLCCTNIVIVKPKEGYGDGASSKELGDHIQYSVFVLVYFQPF